MARKLGVSRNQLANIESGRVAVRFSLGNLFCSNENLSQWWLATGEAPKSPYFELDKSFYEPEPKESALFSEVCFGRLQEILQVRIRLYRSAANSEAAADYLADSYQLLFKQLLPVLVFEVPEDARIDYLTFLVTETRQFIEDHKSSTISDKSLLTSCDVSVTLREVKSIRTMQALRESLQKLLKRPGKRAELMSYLRDVPRESISRWLSGEREPGGETTLQLLNWVEFQERKSK